MHYNLALELLDVVNQMDRPGWRALWVFARLPLFDGLLFVRAAVLHVY